MAVGSSHTKTYDELKEQATGMDAAELIDARLSIRGEKERSATSRIKAAYGEKFDPKSGFKQIYGETPYAYLKKYKMHKAAKLLLETNQRVIEIAAAMGYQNPSKFTEAFFSVMGKKPLEYRKQHEKS